MEKFSHNLVEFYERISSWEQAVVRDSGLSLPQMHTIEVLGNDGPLRMKDLAHKLGVVMGTLTVMVNRLEQMGLVLRESNPDDKRSFRIILSESGKEVYKEHHKHHVLLAEEICSFLTEKEQESFNQIIQKILINF